MQKFYKYILCWSWADFTFFDQPFYNPHLYLGCTFEEENYLVNIFFIPQIIFSTLLSRHT
jgi:hypothetical protein